MDRPIRKKKREAPNWVINSLKGLLLFLLFWNLNKQFPNGLLSVQSQPNYTRQYSPTPYIEEISFNHLLSTTKPKINHFMQWGQKKIPFLDPEIIEDKEIVYQQFSEAEFAKMWLDSFSLANSLHS